MKRIDQVIFLLKELTPLKRVFSPSFANDIFNEDLDSSFSIDIDICGCNKAYLIHKIRKCWSCDSSNLSSKYGQYFLPCGEKMNYTSSEDVNEIYSQRIYLSHSEMIYQIFLKTRMCTFNLLLTI